MSTSGTCTVTPGFMLPDDGLLTPEKLRQIATPTVQVDEGAIGARELAAGELQKAVGNSIRPNIFINGNFTEERWIADSLSAPAGADTETSEGWVAHPTGAAVTYFKTEEVPNATAALSAELGGAVGVTVVDFAQNLARSKSKLLTSRLFFSAWIFNNTGASFIPKLVVSTCNTANDFTAVSEQLAIDQVTCPNQAWTQVTQAFDPGDYPNLENGLRVALRFPNASLNAGGKTIRVASAKLEVGDAATAQPWDDGPDVVLLNQAIKETIDPLRLRFAKAWVRFEGSAGGISASFNVASVTVTSAGIYTLNFITAIAGAYCVVGSSSGVESESFAAAVNVPWTGPNSCGISVQSLKEGYLGTHVATSIVCVQIFGS